MSEMIASLPTNAEDTYSSDEILVWINIITCFIYDP